MSRSVIEQPFFTAASNFALMQFFRQLKPKPRESIIPWLESHVDMSFDQTAGVQGGYKPYPYQIEPLEETESPDVHRMTLCQSQRTGKSTIWRMALLKRFADGNCSALVAYPSLDLALKQNTDSVRPLLTTIPEVRSDFASRGNVKVDSYHSPSTSSVAYFIGMGAPVVSLSASFLVADEVDFVELQNSADDAKNTSQLKNIWLRGQTFPNRLMIEVSSPTQYTGPIWEQFKKSSMGFWHLRCVHCGELIIGNRLAFYNERTQKFDGLQWRKDDDGTVIEDSIVYRCPFCGHEHHECDRAKMNSEGKFVHQKPSLRNHRGYQVGALATEHWSWLEIATAQEEATSPDGKKFFSNSVLGMPHKHVAEGDTSVSIEEANRQRQVEYPADLQQRLSIVVMGVDQQRSDIAGGVKYFCSVVRGWDEQGNSWLLSAGTDNSLDAVKARLDATYYGHKVSLCLVDNGSGAQDVSDVDGFVKSNPTVYYYKGTSGKNLENKDFVPSENLRKLFLCHALKYQVSLLDLLYSPKRANGYGWYLPVKLDDAYFEQLCNVKPNTRMGKDSNGWEFSNWAAFGGSRRDFFDSEKQALVALDIACEYLPPKAFARGHVPLFKAKEKLVRLAQMKRLGRRK